MLQVCASLKLGFELASQRGRRRVHHSGVCQQLIDGTRVGVPVKGVRVVVPEDYEVGFRAQASPHSVVVVQVVGSVRDVVRPQPDLVEVPLLVTLLGAVE